MCEESAGDSWGQGATSRITKIFKLRPGRKKSGFDGEDPGHTCLAHRNSSLSESAGIKPLSTCQAAYFQCRSEAQLPSHLSV